MADYQEALAGIEAAVDAGNTDLSALGFWRIVREVKADPALSERWADAVGRIDRKAFRARVRPLFPVALGNAALLAATLAVLAAVEVALRLADGRLGGDPRPDAAGLLILAAAVGLSASVHGPAHWVVGRAVGIRFLHYFLDGPLRIQPGLKTDYGTYLRADPSSRAAMHAAGAVASKVAPLAVFGWAYTVHALRDWELLPAWSLWAVLALAVGQVVTDVVWSTRRSDWKRVRRELAAARGRAAT